MTKKGKKKARARRAKITPITPERAVVEIDLDELPEPPPPVETDEERAPETTMAWLKRMMGW